MRCLLPLMLVACVRSPTDAGTPADTDVDLTLQATRYARFVDPFVGTAGDGHTFPGAVLPGGLAAPSPHMTLATLFDYAEGKPPAPAGYVFGAPTVMGWGLTHLSGVGCPDLGAPMLVVGRDVAVDEAGWAKPYTDEQAWPGYHALTLTDVAEVASTATLRTAVLRVRFEGDQPGVVQLDATRNLSWTGDDGAVHVDGAEISGRSGTGNFCVQQNVQDVLFVARVDPPPDAVGTYDASHVGSEADASGGAAGAWWRWAHPPSEVTIRVGLSFVSVEGARANLEAESPAGQGFDTVAAAALAAWDDTLGRIDVEGGTDEDRRRLYTAVYHTRIHPSVAADVDGAYRRFDGALGDGDPARTHVFSLWDTYRTVHPLLALGWPDVATELVRTIAAMTVEAKRPPMWELAGQEVQMMVGDPADIVVADAVSRGLDVPGLEPLYVLLRDAALDPDHRPGAASYLDLGYVPMEQEHAVWGPVSTTLEYALADDALARLAAAAGHEDDVAALRDRAGSWRTLLDPETSLFRGRYADGRWLDPFDPFAIEGSEPFFSPSGGPGFVEGTAWQYAFMVPHDVEGLADALGGDDVAIARLDAIFDEDRFAAWNEPDLHYPWLYARLGAGERVGPRVREVLARFGPGADGLPGNDDAGTMSAWVVLASIGLYPDPPGSGRWTISAPLFDRIVLGPVDAPITIEAEGEGDSVVAVTLDGVPIDDFAVDHRALPGHVLHVVRGPLVGSRTSD